jgi:hypothetical protein
VLGAVVVQDPSSGFTSDEHAGAGVPGLVAELDAGIEPAFRGPGKNVTGIATAFDSNSGRISSFA